MKKISLCLVILAVILFAAMSARGGHEPTIVSTDTFKCSGVEGFTFDYPYIRNWSARSTMKQGFGRCVIYFNWPKCINYEVAPQVVVEKVPLNVVGEEFDVKSVNRYGVRYEKKSDPSQYVRGYLAKPGHWDWLIFYNRDKAVRISRVQFGELSGACADKYNDFDEKAFYDLIIYTFKWAP